jgi:electron transfer flavoprotein beta subunit
MICKDLVEALHWPDGDFLKIIILIKSVQDTKVALECVEDAGRLKEDWNVPILNPDDGMAVAAALRIKKEIPGTNIRIVHLGPASAERFIRDAVALGCDEGLRLWDEGLEDLHTGGKLLIFERVARILGFDLLFTGTKSLDTGSAQLGVLLASSLQIPCITRVIEIDAIREGTIAVTRRLEQGYQEQVEALKPLVIAFEADEEPAAYASFPDFVQAEEQEICCWDLSQIGIPRQAILEMESRLTVSPLCLPQPGLQFVQAPDSSLPAFERRRQIGKGSMVRRQGIIVSRSEEAVVEELFQTLLRQGWL